SVGPVSLDEREVGVDRVLEHVVAAVDMTGFLAFGEPRAERGRRVEGADPRAGGANAFGERALRHEFEIDLACAVKPVEVPRIRLTRKRAEDLAHAPGADQPGEPRVG